MFLVYWIFIFDDECEFLMERVITGKYLEITWNQMLKRTSWIGIFQVKKEGTSRIMKLRNCMQLCLNVKMIGEIYSNFLTRKNLLFFGDTQWYLVYY